MVNIELYNYSSWLEKENVHQRKKTLCDTPELINKSVRK